MGQIRITLIATVHAANSPDDKHEAPLFDCLRALRRPVQYQRVLEVRRAERRRGGDRMFAFGRVVYVPGEIDAGQAIDLIVTLERSVAAVAASEGYTIDLGAGVYERPSETLRA